VSPSLSLITTLLLVFATAIVGGLIAKTFKQSPIVGYILGGCIVGALGIARTNHDVVEMIANIGVTLLLFTLGVEFSFHRLRAILRTIAWATTAQIVFSLLIFLIVLMFMGFSLLPALFIAAAGALSSTAVVVKVLSERGELDTIPGEVTVAWLVVQDLAVIPLMVILPTFAALSTSTSGMLMGSFGLIVLSLGKAVLLLGIVVALGRVGIARALSFVAKSGSRELFLLATVGVVCIAATTTYVLGLSAPLGAFIAGLLIADTSQNHAVFAEIRPLRDLFATVFFVTIGMVLPIPLLLANWPMIAGLIGIVMFVKWFVVMGLMRYLGYHPKSAFLVALALTQMSEFGFILSTEGVRIGALSQMHAAILGAITFGTILVGTPLFSRGHDLYALFTRTIGNALPGFFATKEEEFLGKPSYPIEHHVVICGYGRVGKYVGRALLMAKIPFLVVDYNTATVASLKEQGIPVVFGDPADKDVLDYAQVDLARAIVIAIPDRHTQELIIGHVLTLNKNIKIICRTHHEEDQPYLKSLGVHTVIQPEFEAAISIAERLLGEYGVEEEGIAGKVSRLKIEHGMG